MHIKNYKFPISNVLAVQDGGCAARTYKSGSHSHWSVTDARLPVGTKGEF